MTTGRQRRIPLRDALLDVVGDAFGALSSRGRRTALTVLGLAFAVMSLAGAAGISATTAAQIDDRFSALLATRVVGDSPDLGQADRLDDIVSRAGQLNGVQAAGALTMSSGRTVPLRHTRAEDPDRSPQVSVLAMTPGGLAADQVTVLGGRLFDAGHARRQDPVILLGARAARDLGLESVDGHRQVVLGETAFTVIGIVTAPAALSLDVTLNVVIPRGQELPIDRYLSWGPTSLVLATAPGAAQQVGQELPLVVSPRDPRSVAVQVPPDPAQLRRGISGDTRFLVVATACVTLVVAGLGVATTMYVSVQERRSEFGVRRAIGTGTGRIVALVLVEGAFLGAAGGVIGTVLGVNATAAAALVRGWTATVPEYVYWGGPGLGVLVGALAGTAPAVVAARARPIDAIRR